MRFIMSLLFIAFASATMAAPQQYAVDPANTDVGFTYFFGEKPIHGTFPDYDIDVAIDFGDVSNSTVLVALKTQTATGGFIFGTQAMRSKKILSARAFPAITFKSTSVTGGGDTAQINGDITIRGVTNPLTLTAKLFRPNGTTANDLDDLTLKITGTVDRFAFGADGYADEVGAALEITIDAAIKKQ